MTMGQGPGHLHFLMYYICVRTSACDWVLMGAKDIGFSCSQSYKQS